MPAVPLSPKGTGGSQPGSQLAAVIPNIWDFFGAPTAPAVSSPPLSSHRDAAGGDRSCHHRDPVQPVPPQSLLPRRSLHRDRRRLPLRALSRRIFRERHPLHRHQRGKTPGDSLGSSGLAPFPWKFPGFALRLSGKALQSLQELELCAWPSPRSPRGGFRASPVGISPNRINP